MVSRGDKSVKLYSEDKLPGPMFDDLCCRVKVMNFDEQIQDLLLPLLGWSRKADFHAAACGRDRCPSIWGIAGELTAGSRYIVFPGTLQARLLSVVRE